MNLVKFCKMSIHIGRNIHTLIKNRGIKAKSVAKAINISESSLYKIYKKRTIDIDKLIKFSQYLGENFFLPYFEQEPLKGMFRRETERLNKESEGFRSEILKLEKRIAELENINSSQHKVITLLERSKTDVNDQRKGGKRK